jgi:hypothetical protein
VALGDRHDCLGQPALGIIPSQRPSSLPWGGDATRILSAVSGCETG